MIPSEISEAIVRVLDAIEASRMSQGWFGMHEGDIELVRTWLAATVDGGEGEG
jgi:hypothetical protein